MLRVYIILAYCLLRIVHVLSVQIHTFVIEPSDDTAEMEAQVLEMIDKLYNVYVVQVSGGIHSLLGAVGSASVS